MLAGVDVPAAPKRHDTCVWHIPQITRKHSAHGDATYWPITERPGIFSTIFSTLLRAAECKYVWMSGIICLYGVKAADLQDASCMLEASHVQFR